MHQELSGFATRLRDHILLGGRADLFDRLALELFSLQFQNNPAYQKICEARGVTPLLVKHWNQIPAVPTAAFKELELTCLPPAERSAIFHSSGTTEQKPSRHYHGAESLGVYGASLWTWFKSHFELNDEFIFLTPNGNAAPRSSLVHMFETIRQKTGGDPSAFYGQISADGSWTVDLTVLQKLKRAGDTGKPVTLLGTAFSFVHLLDHMAENGLQFQSPSGSSVMETGGYKNRSRILPQAELHALITDRLGVPPEKIICEYGMSELSSQAYATGARPRIFRFPPWARVQIISPETGQEVADGETGIVRIFDLANVFSVAAVQTEDLGIRRGDGFELIGRAPLAEPRGCSLMTA
jgi:hypothetical protein